MVLEATNTVEFVVTYLALLDGDHVPLLAGAHHQDLADAWQPDAVIHTDAGGWDIERRRPARERELHPELALLLSTSGSTGAPKLVRLSHRNLASNARGHRRVPRPHARTTVGSPRCRCTTATGCRCSTRTWPPAPEWC